MKKVKASHILMSLLISVNAYAQNKTDDIVGTWLTAGKEPAKIQVYKKGEYFYGKIIWLKHSNVNQKQRLDFKNPDYIKRSNSLIGLMILTDFKFDGVNEWKGGEIYDPENGKTYSSFLYLKDKNTLKVRGYVGISILGRTETWIRTN